MNWFIWARGPGAQSVVTKATREVISSNRAPTVIGKDGFRIAYASVSETRSPDDTGYAQSNECTLLLVGCVTDWTRLEGLGGSSSPWHPGESRAEWLLRVHQTNRSLDWVDHLDGTFAVMLHDQLNDALYVARDPMGGLPVFWVRAAGTLILCSHVSTLLALPSVSAHLNEQEASRYLFCNQISDTPETLVKSIYQVRADERTRLDSCGATCVHRWTPRIAVVSDDDQDATSEFRRRLESAITVATRGSRRPAVALSGGLDSSALAALLVRQRTSGSVATHSVTYGQFASERARITTFIQEVSVRSTVVSPEPEEFAADLGTLVRVTDLPFAHPGYYTHFRAYKSAKSEGADVVLIGEGADGSFGARARFGSALIRDLARSEGILYAFREARNLARNNGWNYVLGERLLHLLPRRLQARVLWHAWGCDVPPAWRGRFDGFAPKIRRGSLTRVLARELSSLFAPEMWQYRRMGRHFGLDVRYPFLDARVTEWTLGLPPRLRIHDGLQKWALRSSLGGIVPDEVRMSKEKVGFTFPLYTWASGPLRSFFKNVLQHASRREYGDATLLRRRLDGYLKSPIGRHENAIWRIVNLEVWRRLVLDREDLPPSWFAA